MAIRKPCLFNEVAVEALPCGLVSGEGEEAPLPPPVLGSSLVASSPGWAHLGAPECWSMPEHFEGPCTVCLKTSVLSTQWALTVYCQK